MRILLVDDEPSVRELALRVLERAGHEVTVAATGRQGLELFRAHGCDVLFVDKNLPDGSGLDVIRAVRAAEPDLPVILVTGAPERLAHDAARPDVYLAKPFKTLSALAEAVAEALEKRRIMKLRRDAQRQLDEVSRQLRGPTA